MDALKSLLNEATKFIPASVAVVVAFVVIMAARFLLERKSASPMGGRVKIQVITLLLSFAGLIAIILALPISDATVGQLLGLIGIVLSAAIALSSTTILGNVLAGFMLRAIRNFRPGDFIRVGDHFGRVSERGLFHVEIQTEDRDLTTLPNLFLVSNPVKVVRASGTLVTADVSLGYDVPRSRVEHCLLSAAQDTELNEPFVYVLDLGDYSVSYRVAGLLTDVKSLISTRSRLRQCMLDRLHGAGIEIVSPTFMNQRALSPEKQFIPEPSVDDQARRTESPTPETVVFDKADEAESLEKLRERHAHLLDQIKHLKVDLSGARDDLARKKLDDRLAQLESQAESLLEHIAIIEREQGDKSTPN